MTCRIGRANFHVEVLMRTRHGEEGLVDDGWIGSSQLNMTEPELPTPNSYAPCRFVRNSKRSAMNCTALHRGAIRFDAINAM